MTIKKRTRILSEHNSDGTHNSAAATTLSIQLTKYYESPEQTISQAGLLQLTHSLGAEPLIKQYHIVCKTAELGYSIGHKVDVIPQMAVTTYGFASEFNSTTINIRFADGSQPIRISNYTTGALAAVNITYWKFVVRAWA